MKTCNREQRVLSKVPMNLKSTYKCPLHSSRVDQKMLS